MPSLKIQAAESNVAIWEKNIAMLSFVRTNQCSGDRLSASTILGLTLLLLLLSGEERISAWSGIISTRSGWTSQNDE